MHRLAGAIASLSAAALVTFVADANTQPHPLAIPILVVLLLAAAVAWWFTKPPKGSASVSASSFKGKTIAAGRDSYNAGGDINVAQTLPDIHSAQALSEARSELKANRDRIAEAEQKGFYNFRFPLSETKRARAGAVLSGTLSWEPFDDAYRACEGLKHWLRGRGMGDMDCDRLDVLPEDGLPGRLSQIELGLAELGPWP